MPDEPILTVRLTNYNAVKAKLEEKGRTYRGAFRDTIKRMLMIMRNYAHYITHRESGTLARAHQVYYEGHRLRGYVYLSDDQPHVRGSTIQYPSEYGTYEHARGGTHAFYERAINEMGNEVGWTGIRMMVDYMSD